MTETINKIEETKYSGDSLITSIVICLNEFSSESKMKINDNKYEEFICKKPPSISVEDYLRRIIKYTNIEESTLIISLIYLDRVCDVHNITLDNHSIHKYINIDVD